MIIQRLTALLFIPALILQISCGSLASSTPTPASATRETAVASPTPAPTSTNTPIPTPEVPLGGVRAWIAPAVSRMTPGELAVMTVTMDSAQVGLSAADLTLTFDPTAVRILGVEPGTLLGNDTIEGLKHIDQVAGKIRIALARIGTTEVTTGSGVLVTMTVQVLETVDLGVSLDLAIDKLHVVNATFEPIQNVELQHSAIHTVSP